MRYLPLLCLVLAGCCAQASPPPPPQAPEVIVREVIKEVRVEVPVEVEKVVEKATGCLCGCDVNGVCTCVKEIPQPPKLTPPVKVPPNSVCAPYKCSCGCLSGASCTCARPRVIQSTTPATPQLPVQSCPNGRCPNVR